MAKHEEPKETKEEHCKKLRGVSKLRENLIEGAKKLVVEKPDKFDAAKLTEYINAVNKVPDKNIDAWAILGKHLDILQKPVYQLTDAEVNCIRQAMTNLGYTVDTEKVLNDEPQRSDYQATWKKPDGKRTVIWLNRMRPMFNKNEYGLLCVDLWFPCSTFENMQKAVDRMVEHIKSH